MGRIQEEEIKKGDPEINGENERAEKMRVGIHKLLH